MAYNNIMNFIEKTVQGFTEPDAELMKLVTFEILLDTEEDILHHIEKMLSKEIEDSMFIRLFGLLIQEKYEKAFNGYSTIFTQI